MQQLSQLKKHVVAVQPAKKAEVAEAEVVAETPAAEPTADSSSDNAAE